ITGLLTRPIVAFTKATSSAVVLRPYCAAIHSYPSACRGTISLLKHEPSAQSPWQNTMPGFESLDIAHLSEKGFCSTYVTRLAGMACRRAPTLDRKSTRLNSSHVRISYAVFCLNKRQCRARDSRELPSSA